MTQHDLAAAVRSIKTAIERSALSDGRAQHLAAALDNIATEIGNNTIHGWTPGNGAGCRLHD